MRELLDGWRTDQQRRGLMPSTITRRGDMVRGFARWLEPRPLTNATEDDVQRFLDARHIGARTRYTWVSALGCFYQWAIVAGHVDTDPTARIVRPKLRRTLPRPISDADLEHAITNADPQRRCWLTLAAYSGLRCAEIAGLHRDDIIGDAGLLRIVGKGQRERLVPMHPRVIDQLAAWPTPKVNGPLFRRPHGAPWSPAALSRAGSVHLHSHGIDATMHQLRHWFGTRTYQASRDLRVVQELMGHSSPTTTAIYTAFSDEDARAAVMRLA